jgi:hypothetical protein
MKEAGIGTGAESSIRFPQSPTRFPAGSVSFDLFGQPTVCVDICHI